MIGEVDGQEEVARRIGRLYGAFEAGQLLLPGMFVLGCVTGWLASRAQGMLSAGLIVVVGIAFLLVVISSYRRTFRLRDEHRSRPNP